MGGPFDSMMPYLKQLQEQYGSLFGAGQSGAQGQPGGLFGQGTQGGMGGMGGWPFATGSMNPNNFLRNMGLVPGGSNPFPVDIYETGDTVVVIAEIPGLTKASDAALTILQSALIIKVRVERRYGSNRNHTQHVSERQVGEFERQIELPVRVVTKGAHARYQNGLLEVEMVRQARQAAADGVNVPINFL